MNKVNLQLILCDWRCSVRAVVTGRFDGPGGGGGRCSVRFHRSRLCRRSPKPAPETYQASPASKLCRIVTLLRMQAKGHLRLA